MPFLEDSARVSPDSANETCAGRSGQNSYRMLPMRSKSAAFDTIRISSNSFKQANRLKTLTISGTPSTSAKTLFTGVSQPKEKREEEPPANIITEQPNGMISFKYANAISACEIHRESKAELSAFASNQQNFCIASFKSAKFLSKSSLLSASTISLRRGSVLLCLTENHHEPISYLIPSKSNF